MARLQARRVRAGDAAVQRGPAARPTLAGPLPPLPLPPASAPTTPGTALVTFSDELSGKHSGSGGGDPPGGSGGSSAGSSGGAPAAGERSVWGDLLCLLSAALYAGYTIVLRAALPDEGEAGVALFFGYVGLFCTSLFAPVLGGLAAAGALDLSRVTGGALGLILLQGARSRAAGCAAGRPAAGHEQAA